MLLFLCSSGAQHQGINCSKLAASSEAWTASPVVTWSNTLRSLSQALGQVGNKGPSGALDLEKVMKYWFSSVHSALVPLLASRSPRDPRLDCHSQ